LKAKSRYVVYASIWHVPPPAAKVKSEIIAVFDAKGRLVGEFGMGFSIHDYDGRYSKRVGRLAVAGYLNGEWEENVFTGDEVVLASTEEVERRASIAPPGGFHVFVAGEHVPLERIFYLKAIFSRALPNAPEVAMPERDNGVPDMVPTEGTDVEPDLKRALIQYLSKKYQWYLDPDEVHLISDKELERLRKEAEEMGYEFAP
jgi:hypothetical protein